MKSSFVHSALSIALISVVLIFSSPVFGDDTTDMLSKALGLVHQVENPTGNPPTDAQRIDLLTQAITTAQEAPNHRLKGHRVLAIQAIRSAITEIRAGDPNHQAATYLHTADTELVASVSLAAGAPTPTAMSTSPSPAPLTPIETAARAGDLEKVKAMVQADPNLVFSKDDCGMTPLLIAAAADRKDVADWLLANKADANAKNVFGQTPLYYAALGGFADMTEVLLANKANVNAKDVNGLTPLYLAVMFDHSAVAAELLAHQADVKAVGPNGTLLDMAVMSAKTDLVELLLAHGADVNARDKNGDTPLYLAVNSRARDDVAKVLLAHGADANAKGHDGLTPLQTAIKYDDDDMANILRRPEIAVKDESTPPVDMGVITGVITRLVTNASKKPPGPVEDDITGQSNDAIAGMTQSLPVVLHSPMPPARESIAGEYGKFTIEGPFTLVQSQGPAVIVSGKVKMTPAALADWKSDPPSESSTFTINGKTVADNTIGPMFSDVGGSQYLESKVRDDGQVVATFCLLLQHGSWKVHCVALSNNPLKKSDVNFFTQQLIAMANKPSSAAVPSGYAILHNFGDGTVPNDGQNPCGSLYQPPGSETLYGVTQDKDNSNSGTIYKITPHGEEMVLHVFNGLPSGNSTPSDEATDNSLTMGFGGEYWGTTHGGGQYNCGTVFKVTRDGTFTTVHEFGSPSIKDGPRGPAGSLILGPDGDVYGTSDFGGTAELGAVFKMTWSGVVTTLHSFGDGSVPHDGGSPRGPLLDVPDADGHDTYYGVTSNGSGNGDKPDFKGTLFKMTSDEKVTILHRFADGSVPNDGKASGKVGLFRASDNTLYGTTEFGGNTTNSGTFFKFTPKGAVTILHVFGDQTSKDGVWPQATLIEGGDGNFYGTTAAGGSANEGTIYKITPEGTVTILHNFGDGTIPHDGIKPEGGLVLASDSDGCLYGATNEGGSAGKGIVFRIKIP